MSASFLNFEGNWNANTNTPTISDASGAQNEAFRVSVSGTQDLGSGSIDFEAGDIIIHNGTLWQNGDGVQVSSVNGESGVVVLDTDDISEGANLYYTEARVNANSNVTANTAKVSASGSIDTHSDVNISSVANNEILQYNSGAGEWQNVVLPGAASVAFVRDLKSNGTDGGTFTSGAWQTRDLNDLSGVTSFISISSNQFDLDDGDYVLEAHGPAHNVARHKLKLRDITNVADIVLGSNAYTSPGSGNVQTNSYLTVKFTATGTTTYEIQHRCSATKADDGFGIDSSFGEDEVYTQVKITKV